MTTLEKQFQEVLIKQCERGQKECASYRPTRFLQTIEKFGAVKTAKEIMRKGRLSDDFEKLQEANLLGLTMEALIVDAKYSDLFTDDEVNSCYEILCEHGYY